MPSLADRPVPDELCNLVEPLLPPLPPREHGGAPESTQLLLSEQIVPSASEA